MDKITIKMMLEVQNHQYAMDALKLKAMEKALNIPSDAVYTACYDELNQSDLKAIHNMLADVTDSLEELKQETFKDEEEDEEEVELKLEQIREVRMSVSKLKAKKGDSGER